MTTKKNDTGVQKVCFEEHPLLLNIVVNLESDCSTCFLSIPFSVAFASPLPPWNRSSLLNCLLTSGAISSDCQDTHVRNNCRKQCTIVSSWAMRAPCCLLPAFEQGSTTIGLHEQFAVNVPPPLKNVSRAKSLLDCHTTDSISENVAAEGGTTPVAKPKKETKLQQNATQFAPVPSPLLWHSVCIFTNVCHWDDISSSCSGISCSPSIADVRQSAPFCFAN